MLGGVFEVEGGGMVGEGLLEAFEDEVVVVDAVGVVGVDEGTTVKVFIECDEGVEGTLMLLDEVVCIFLLLYESVAEDGVAFVFLAVVGFLVNGSRDEKIVVASDGVDEGIKDFETVVAVVLELPEEC